MIKKITLLVALLISFFSFGQSPYGHLTIFSEDGDRFRLILNGELINEKAETNLRVEELNQPYYNAKIQFEDKSLMDITSNNLMIADADGIFADVTYKIRRDKKNKAKMKMSYFSSIPVTPDFIPPSNVHVIHYGRPRMSTGGISQTTTTTTVTEGVGGVGANVNVGGISMNVSIHDPVDATVTQTTTTTSTNNYSDNYSNSYASEERQPKRRGCANGYAMSQSNFSSALESVKKQGFDDTRLKVAKQIVSANCLNVNQISQIAKIFGFEETKLTFTKFAYDFCVDPRNYFKLNDLFSFSSNVDELSDYVSNRN